MKTINQILLLAALTVLIALTSCNEDSLLGGVSDMDTTGQTKEEVFIEEATIETLDSIAVDTTTPSEVDARSLQLIYETTATVSQNNWYLLYYNKGDLDPSYRYVIVLTPYSGDPDLYIHGYSGTYRTIRGSKYWGTTKEDSYFRLTDLKNYESRLYMSVYGNFNSSFKIQIYKEFYCATGCLQGRYNIQTGVANKFLDVQWGSNATGTPVHIWPYNGGAAQRWTLYHAGGSYYYIRSDVGTYLDVKNANAASTTPVWMYPYNGSIAQKWQPIAIGNGYYYLRSQLGTYLDVKGGVSADGTPIWMYSFNGSNAQRWKLSGI